MTSQNEELSVSHSAVARLRLLRRMVAALGPLEDAGIVPSADNPTAGPGQTKQTTGLRTDFLIKSLDLRIRVAAMPGLSGEFLPTELVLKAAMMLLIENPETAAIAVVADDTDLPTRIVEPFDAATISPHPGSADPLEPASYPPFDRAIKAYLGDFRPGWVAPPRISRAGADFDALAKFAISQARRDLQDNRKNTPEWRDARTNLGATHDERLSRFAGEVLTSAHLSPDELHSRIEEISRHA